MEDKSFQIDRASEEGKWGRGHNIGLAVHNVGVEGRNLKDADERKSPRIGFRERYDVPPVAFREFEAPDLLSARGD